ncbi:MAG: hypothetical protein AAF583_03955 [Pseudomonadota bacterium]
MITGKKIIFFELNEVPFRILDHFSKVMPESNLARLRKACRAYETVAEDSGHLSPWITWPTLHRGVTNDIHEITDLGVDLTRVDKELPPVWKILAESGVNVGMFGSLHSHPLPEDLSNYSFYVPDTFAAGPECFPKRYEAFQDFNLKMAGMNGRSVSKKIAFKEAARFLLAAPELGLRGNTALSLVKQLTSERIAKQRTVRRRTSQVQIAFDFFIKALSSDRPEITFFFTNHVASSMHRYWPAIFPDDYQSLLYDQEWIAKWKEEIPFTMRVADQQLGALMAFVDNNHDYSLIIATSMGQAAVEGRMKIKKTIIVKSLNRLMEAIGMSPTEWERRPAMVPQYNVAISDSARAKFLTSINLLRVNGKNFKVTDTGDNVFSLSLFLPNKNEIEAVLGNMTISADTAGLKNVDLLDAAGSNAYHIPEGMLMVYDPRSHKPSKKQERPRISTLDIAPALLGNFGIPLPEYMNSVRGL